MKKSPLISLWLILIDQSVKLVIANFYMDKGFSALNGIIRFQPWQNTNLSWISSMFNYRPPNIAIVFTVILAVFLFIMACRYLLFAYGLQKQGKVKCILNLTITFASAGIFCSFIDTVFWGGSLDFIRLFDLPIFDLKDLYLNIGIVLLGALAVNLYLILSKEERKKIDVGLWIKKGCPKSREMESR